MKMKFGGIAILTLMSAIFLSITCEKQPAGPDVNDEIKPKGSICGWVTDKKGTPIGKAIVSVDADSAVPGVSDSMGFFRIGQVKKGTYVLKFTHRDWFADSTYTVSIGMGEDDTVITPIKLSYNNFILSGRVIYNNSGVPGAGVALSGYPISTLTDGSGRYRLDGVPRSAKMKLICAKSGIGFCVDSSITGVLNDTTKVRDLGLTSGGAIVYGTVYDTSDNPITTISVVAAVGGGLVDTTDNFGNYKLENVPTNEIVNIYVPGNELFYGSTIGFMLNEGSMTKIDIHLRPVTTLIIGNGMSLYVNDIIVNDMEKNARLPVFPTTDVNTVIKSFQWEVTGALSFRRFETTEPALSISIDTLLSLTGRSATKTIQAGVEAVNTGGLHSQKQYFRVTIATTKPTAIAKVSSTAAGPFVDTVKITIGDFAFFKGEASDPFGGIDSVSWYFGDATPVVSDMVSIAHLYGKTGTYYTRFRVVDNDKNIAIDSVKVTVGEPALGRPGNITPKDKDTIFNIDTVTLRWHPVTGNSITYDVYLDSLNFPAGLLKIANSTDTFARLPVDSGITYCWKVVAKRGPEKGVGDCWTFRAGGTLPNKPPQFTSDSTGMTTTAKVGKLYKDTAIARDQKDDSLVFSLIDSIAGMGLAYIDSLCFISWTPQISDTGKKHVSLRVSDQRGGYDTLQWTIKVVDNTMPLNEKLEMVVPKGGEQYKVGDTVTIKFKINPLTVAGAVLALSIDSGKTFRSITGNSLNPSGIIPQVMSYSWIIGAESDIVNFLPSNINCIVQVRDYSNPSVNDGSKIFTITKTIVKPTITGDPQPKTVSVGQTATFGVVANGTKPFSYIWQKNDTAITGAQDSSYTTPASILNMNGAVYRCIVGNSAGSDTSSTALLTVNAIKPTITCDPQLQMVTAGQAAIFGVSATGTMPFIYNWQKNGADISGATDSIYTIAAAPLSDSGSLFRCIVSNSAGADTSATALLNKAASRQFKDPF